jgi:hypothetical protein
MQSASCTTNTKPYIKTGDSFDVPIQLINTVTGEAVEITPSMDFTTKIVDLLGNIIATPTITPYPNQVQDKGYLLITVDSSITQGWSVGKAKFDIKFELDGSVRHSQDFSFYVVESIT